MKDVDTETPIKVYIWKPVTEDMGYLVFKKNSHSPAKSVWNLFGTVCKVSHFALRKNVFWCELMHNQIIKIAHRY